MNAAAGKASFGDDEAFSLLGLFLVAPRALGLFAIALAALLDAAAVRLFTEPTGARLAHARAAWLHRWCRVARLITGLHVRREGFVPVSGVIVANRGGLIDAMVLASVLPCVFVAGEETRRLPVIGLIACFAGTIFIDSRQRRDVLRGNLLVERALRRRIMVVVFPECFASEGMTRRLSSALLQPAIVLQGNLTSAVLELRADGFPSQGGLAQVLCASGASVRIAFGGPTYRKGNRKEQARQIRRELRFANVSDY